MGRFINGVLVGAAIALLVAPMPGEDLRRLIRERWEEMSGSQTGDIQPGATGRKVTSNTQQTAGNFTDAVRRAARQGEQTSSSVISAATRRTQLDETAEAPFPSAYPEFVDPEINQGK
jgi:gas vesicle protein